MKVKAMIFNPADRDVSFLEENDVFSRDESGELVYDIPTNFWDEIHNTIDDVVIQYHDILVFSNKIILGNNPFVEVVVL